MDTTSAALPATGAIIACDREQLRITLHKAVEEANRSERTILASFSQPVPLYDPLHFFAACRTLRLGNNMFWSRPAEQHALVGTGVVTTIKTVGLGYVGAATARWRELQQRLITGRGSGVLPTYIDGPVLFGGFAFDPLYLRTRLWRTFPDSLLIMSRLLFVRDEDAAALIINTRVAPGAVVSQLEAAIAHDLDCLQTALAQTDAPTLEPPAIQQSFTMQEQLPPATWKQMVADAVRRIREGEFQKIVLARSMSVTAENPFAITPILSRLRESYPAAYVFAIQRGERYFIGATPERLLCGADGQIQTMALAGSAPRGQTPEEDRRLGEDLLNSPKNRAEHQVVVNTIRNSLGELCSRLWIADAPRLLKLKNIQHLETPIVGDLPPGRSILEAIEYLHPTPAVGGFPRRPALAAIRAHEQLDRGWYAAPIGWVGTHSNGEFAVALRSALIEGRQATLFAGCGIVADSEPESEYAESCLKMRVMLRGLGCED